MNYRFNKEAHLHQIEKDGEWQNLTGVTTVLSVIAKPALIQWAANQTAEYFRSHFSEFNLKDAIQLGELLQLAKTAHTKRKTEAGDYGKLTHELIEIVIKNAIEKNDGYVNQSSSENVSVKNFITWALENKVKFLESEKNLYSETLWLGGILDALCEIDGKVWLMDIKTAKSGLYAENMWQMGGYELMLKECTEYKKIKGYILLNLKQSGEFIEKRSISNKEHIKAFLACLEIYRQKEKTSNQIL